MQEGSTVPYLPLQDVTLYYEVNGEGCPIVLIHGMGLSHINWSQQVAFFVQEGFQTITLDIRGHGRSTETLPDYQDQSIIRQMTEDIYALLQHLKIDKAILVGYSTGTIVCQQFTFTYPERVAGLVLSGSFPKISNLYLYGKFALPMCMAYLHIRKPLEKGVARSNGKDEEQIRLFAHEAKKVRRKETIRILKDSFSFNCKKFLQGVQVPLLVTYGGNERYMMKYRSEYLSIAQAVEVCLFPNVNHATLTKCTRLYNQVLLDFFNRICEG